MIEKRADDPAPGVVDENIDPPEVFHRRIDHSPGLILAGEVSGECCGPHGSVDFAGGSGGAFGVEVANHDRCPIACQARGDDAPDAPARAGDNSNLA